MMNPKISVIIPIYNMGLYLARCLNSVLNNTYRNLEIICIDDGSKDDSLEILRRFENEDSRIIEITKTNGGVSSARNVGLDQVTGEYICFVDPDDFIHPKFFESLLSAILENENCIAVCGFRTMEEKDLPLLDTTIQLEPEKLFVVNRTEFFKNHNFRSFCGGRLIPTKMLQGLRFREELTYSEDSVFFAELGERNPEMSCAVLAEPLYYYYQRENSLVKQAKVSNRYLVAEIFTQKVLSAEENDSIYLDQAIKRSLSTHYYAVHIYPDKQIARKCTRLLKSCLPVLRRTDIYSRREKAIYSAFIHFPKLYWLYRSIKEPDMWAWEKVERKKRWNERRGVEEG